MRVLVCGGRDFDNYALMERTLYANCPSPAVGDGPGWLPPGDLVIIHGAAKGADALADQWTTANWVKTEVYPADWKTHGKAAGPARNQRMLDEGKPDLVIAFPGGRGTADMVKRAKKAGIEVMEVEG